MQVLQPQAKRSALDFYRSGRVGLRPMPGKRLFDIVFASTALLCGAPLFLGLALAVRLASPGPILFGHQRVGRGGRIFRCYKFRSMYPDAEQRLEALLASNPELRHEWEASQKLKNDPRVTPIGKILRRYSLDELPQFLNVLKGDLSIVGPRPLVREEIEKHVGRKAIRTLSVNPGLTCLWQVAGRSNLSYEERISLDEEYVRKRSALLDIKIILKTIPAMLFSRGAY